MKPKYKIVSLIFCHCYISFLKLVIFVIVSTTFSAKLSEYYNISNLISKNIFQIPKYLIFSKSTKGFFYSLLKREKKKFFLVAILAVKLQKMILISFNNELE